MRIRGMRPTDREGLAEVYEGRARTAAAPMRRSPAYWRRRTRKRAGRAWVVAEDRGRIAGYALALVEGGVASVRDVIWRPEHDRTDLGERLLREALRRADRRRPCTVTANEMAGSPQLPLVRRAIRHEEPPLSLFMAAALDTRDLLHDAVRVVRKRVRANLRLRAGGREASTGRGRVAATLSMDPNVLLGLLLGIRSLAGALQAGSVRVTPRTTKAMDAARAAFPERRFWIADSW